MDRFIQRAEKILKKQLISLTLACAMLVSVAPMQVMAAAEKPAGQTLVKNSGFESGDLSGWTVLTPGWGVNSKGSPAGVVSAVSYGECEMPTNQSGGYHLSGLYNGIPAVEGWAVRSSNFLLSGSGWISVKMGGQAASVKVFLADGTQVGYYRQNRFHDVNYPYLSQGGSWNDMATYVMDLSEYLGREMYVVLCDEVIEGSYANALFDDVITYYDVAPEPTFRYDTVMDGHEELGSASEVQIPWVMGYNSYEPCTENEVQNGGFESGDLTGWTVLTEGFDAAGAVVNERTYWAQELPYNQSGYYHLNGWNTGIPEAEGWAVRSSTFVLGGSGYISVKMGGNAAVTKVFLSDGTQVGYYRNFRFHDVNFPYISQGGAWCDMATYVIDLSDYLGKEMYIELHDEVITDGWANAFFDDVVTCYETAPDASQHYDKVPDGHIPGESAKLAQIPWVSVPKISTEAARQIPNGDFETGDLRGWTLYASGFPIKNGLPAANTAETFWDQELPFNKSGNYFVNGWDLSGNEASTWRIRSTPFTLEGSGWISVKMGGHAAAVRVYRMDGTMVGEFDQSRFCDKEFPYISKGGSWCEMATYLLDLTQNIGEVLYIELCDDTINGGWANAFFDDVVTYYEKVPVANKYETVKDGHQPGEKARTVKIPTVVGMNNLYSPRNGGFEMGNLTGWTVIADYFKPNTAVLPIKDYNIDDENIPEWRTLPYNTSGNYILSGHDATQEDADTWTLRSSPFTLAGSGYISVKMGGRTAAFQVRTVKDDKIVAYCEQRRFRDYPFPYISKGGSWRDMAVYVMDLSQFLGEKLVIELMDEENDGEGGWKNAYFDDVIAYYPQRPTTKSDTVIDGYRIGYDEPKEIEIPWIYLDGHEYEMGNRFPLTPSLKDPSGSMAADKTGNITDSEGNITDSYRYKTVNLYDYFKTEQGLNDYQLDASKLTFTKVTCYKADNSSTGIIADYSKLNMKEGCCYVAEYKFEQGGVTKTGSFNIVVQPEGGLNKVFNGGFETGNLAGWKVIEGDGFDTNGAVISAETYWDDNLPYNQEGNYHLDGWNTGIVEEKTWDVRSSTFTLSGSGYISWRMAGRTASLSVHMADSGAEIARVRTTDSLNAHMTTYVLNLSTYIGDKLYIELHDEEGVDNWAQAFFDEIVTYYDNANDAINASEHEVVEQGAFYFTEVPTNDVLEPAEMSATKEVNLAKIVSDNTEVSYMGQKKGVTVEVTRVEFEDSKVFARAAADYKHYDMSMPGMYRIFYQAVYGEERSDEKSFTLITYDENTIPNGGFETGDLKGWTPLTEGFNANTAVISAATWWGEQMPYNQAGDYHLDGWYTGIEEGDSWAVRSKTFTLGGSGFISVRMGGKSAAVKVYMVNEDGSSTQVGHYRQNRFRDIPGLNVAVGSWADMGTYVIDLTEYLGKTLYIELCDEVVEGGWAHAFFDEVVTYYETAPDWENMSDSVNNGSGRAPGVVNIDWQLANAEPPLNPGQSAPAGAQIENGGFETGDLSGWKVLTEGFNADGAVISAKTYWGEKLPYNQAGRYHLDGWQTGIAENSNWAIRSSNFTLGGSGYISVRMGGNAAAVKVYKADGALIGYYKQVRFNDGNFPNAALGSWADMGTYVMDLSDYIGQELYIELWDEIIDGGWANAFFDEVVTYYETAPDYANSSDSVANSAGQSPANVNIPWRLADNMAESIKPAPRDIANGGFETGDLTGWTWSGNGFKADEAVISAQTYWDENLPYNQAGEYHLDGWATGVAEGDNWSVRSSTFTLDGSGYISVRMGGHAAAVKVYQSNGALIGYYKQTRFRNDYFPDMTKGSWADMGTYVMDLSDYIGQELYIELWDEIIDGGWAHAFFDEVVTYYETAPDWENRSDSVTNAIDLGPANIPWQLAWNELDGPRPEAAMLLLDETDDVSEVGIDEEAAPEAEPDLENFAEPEEATAPEDTTEPEETDEPEGMGESEENTEPEDNLIDCPEELGEPYADEAADNEQ